jgi:hypothetical protein
VGEELLVLDEDDPPAHVLTPRARAAAGVVALAERDTIVVADLAITSKGIAIRRAAVARNGEDGASWTIGEPGSVAKALAAAVARAKLPRRITAVALCQSLTGVQHTVLPPVKGRLRDALLAKRLAELVNDEPGEWVIDTLEFRNRGERAGSGPNAVIAWADAPVMRAWDAAFSAAKLEVGRCVPPMVALLNLLAQAHDEGGAEPEIVVHAALPSLCIVLHEGEELLYARLLRDVLAAEPERFPETVQTEVQRTAAFFAENKRGRRAGHVAISGLSKDHAGRFAAWLAQNVGLPALPLALARKPGQADPAGVDVSAALPILTGLLLHEVRPGVPASRPIDLFARRRRHPKRWALAAAGLVLVLAGVAWARTHFDAPARRQQGDVSTAGSEIARLEAEQVRRAVELGNAQRVAAEQQCLAAIGAADGNPVLPLMEAMLLVPPGLEIESSRLERPATSDLGKPEGAPESRLELTLRGDFTGIGPQLVQQYVRMLEKRPWCRSTSASVESGGVDGEDGAPLDEVRIEVLLR